MSTAAPPEATPAGTPPAPRLEPALRAVLAPLLREDGFRGSGRRFHKLSDGWLQLVNVQGSRFGSTFAINLALHFTAAPATTGNLVDPAKMTEADCEFSRRLSQDGPDMWWRYERHDASVHEAVESAAAMYAACGRRYLASALATLQTVTPEAVSAGDYDLHGFHASMPRLGLALARIRKLEGQHGDSRKFARLALQRLEVAVPWRAELEALAGQGA